MSVTHSVSLDSWVRPQWPMLPNQCVPWRYFHTGEGDASGGVQSFQFAFPPAGAGWYFMLSGLQVSCQNAGADAARLRIMQGDWEAYDSATMNYQVSFPLNIDPDGNFSSMGRDSLIFPLVLGRAQDATPQLRVDVENQGVGNYAQVRITGAYTSDQDLVMSPGLATALRSL